MLGAGAYRKTAAFERNTAARGALGGKAADAWTPLFTLRASVRYGNSAERREAAGEQAIQTATIAVRASPNARTVTVADRVVVDGVIWDITGIAVDGGAVPREIEFTATTSRG